MDLKVNEDFIVKLNIGGLLFETFFSTLNKFGSNFLTQIVQSPMSSRKDANGYYFIDRNGQAFHPILDYLRTAKLIPNGLSLKSILVEANYYSINLAHAFCGNLQEGLYMCESIHGAEILYVERDRNIPWLFGITGALYGEKDKEATWIDFWQEVFAISEEEIENDEFCITCADETSFFQDYILVRQKKIFNSVKRFNLVSTNDDQSGRENINLFPDTWWVGNKFVSTVGPSLYSFCMLDDDRQRWVLSIDCGGGKIIGPFDVTIKCPSFFCRQHSTVRFLDVSSKGRSLNHFQSYHC